MIHLHFNHHIVVFEDPFDVHKPFEPLNYASKTQSPPMHVHINIHIHYFKIVFFLWVRKYQMPILGVWF